MRIRTAGRVGTHDGFYWTQNAPSSGDIDSDNDGEMIPSPNFLIDLSHVGSIALGRQCSMMASYKLHSIRIGIRPVDDTIDNEEAAIFGGRFLNVLATDHAKTALQLARKTEKHLEGGQLDADSLFLSSEKDYSGFRYNWAGTAEDNVVAHATACTVPSMGDHWRIDEIFNLYNNIILHYITYSATGLLQPQDTLHTYIDDMLKRINTPHTIHKIFNFFDITVRQ